MALLFLWPGFLHAQDDTSVPGAPTDDGPAISIKSPDTATTFSYATVKGHELIWDKKKKMLMARITFSEGDSDSMSNDDSHLFRLPGVSVDEKLGFFYAVSAQGEKIPVATYKKALFLKSLETTRNANIRILHPKGFVTIILEAISLEDPAMQGHPVDGNKILN